jgi:hypothetical protein
MGLTAGIRFPESARIPLLRSVQTDSGTLPASYVFYSILFLVLPLGAQGIRETLVTSVS